MDELEKAFQAALILRTSAIRRLQSFIQYVSIEPAILLYAFVVIAYNTAITNLIQQKVCSPKSPPPVDFICNDTALLAEATDVVTVRATLKQILPTIVLLLDGFWRDSTGLNKPTIYFSLFWDIVGTCIEIYAYLNWTSSSWITSITEGTIIGLGGNFSLFIFKANRVISDNNKAEDRTTRFTLVAAEISIGVTLGFGLFGYILTYMGYMWFLIFTIALQLTVGALVMIFVKDNKNKKKKGDICKSIRQFKSAFQKRPNIIVIWFMILACSVYSILSTAELIVYQYYLQQTFGYSKNEAGLYTAYRTIVGSVGSIIVSPILTNLLKWSDFKIGIVCCVVTIISCISMVFATTTLEIYIFGLLNILNVLLFGVPKSVIAKSVNPDEVGMFFSFIFIVKCIAPLVIYYLYDYIYKATFTTLPGAFYLASAAIITILLMFYSISLYIYTPLEAYDKKTENVPEDLENCEEVSQSPETFHL